MPPNDRTYLVGRQVFIRLPGKPIGEVQEVQSVKYGGLFVYRWAYVRHKFKSVWYPVELVELMPQ